MRSSRLARLGFRVGVLAVVPLAAACRARVHAEQHTDHALGTVDFRVSCSAPAQPEFNRAVALLHHMTYPQARDAFERVAASDPGCGMAHWGVAMTLFQPLWPTRPGPEDLQRGWEAVQKARTAGLGSDRERLFVNAAEAFFVEPSSTDYWRRIRQWDTAMQKVSAAFPDDDEVLAFSALAHLATAPSDTISRAHSDRAAEMLMRLYARNPDHPGAMHYLVHANDVSGRERELLEITRKYESVAPRNPHALHMPTHIYTRLGDWSGVIRGNRLAAEAALEHPAGDRGEFVWDEFPHAIEYLVYAYLQKGADSEALAQVARLAGTARLQPTLKTAFHLSSTRARYALERGAWTEAARIVPRQPPTLAWDRFAWPEAISQFARGLGAAHVGEVAAANAAAARLDQLHAATEKAGEVLFARNIRVLRLELGAWLAHVEGQREPSVALMREAAELEASTPKHAVTPGPTLPAHELLGDLLMEQKRTAEALVAYRRSMELYPRRFNGVLGAARAARILGDESLARTFFEALLEIAAGGTPQPALDEAKQYLDRPTASPYFGQPVPALTPALFAPGIVSTDAVELNAVFAPDMKEFFFTRVIEGTPTMFHSQMTDGSWSAPRPLLVYPGQARALAVDMAVSPDGSELFFLGNYRPSGDAGAKRMDTDIWRSRRVNGAWTTADVVPSPVSTEAGEVYPTIVKDGSLYFTSNRPGGLGPNSLYRAQRRADGTFAQPALVPPPINSESGIGDPFVSPDERYMVFSSRRPPSLGGGDLFVAFRRADGGWDEPVHLGKTLNSEDTDFCPFATPDGKYLFFSRRHRAADGTVTAGDVYWIDAKFLEQFRK